MIDTIQDVLIAFLLIFMRNLEMWELRLRYEKFKVTSHISVKVSVL
jgi:hypothetical protein